MIITSLPEITRTQAPQERFGNWPAIDKGALNEEPPLVVDMDGTLIHSDLLWEAIVLFVKNRFQQIWRLPLWLLQGKARFKKQLAEMVEIDPIMLPYDKILIRHLISQREQGRLLVLATGSHRSYAEKVADHLKLFDLVLATEANTNLTSLNKADALVSLYGERGYDYVGNSSADIAVWEHCRRAYSVTQQPFLLADGRVTEEIGSLRAGWGLALVTALRPRQWLKNLLVFLPVLAAHSFDVPTVLYSLLALVIFSLCASSAYLLNDALDSSADRQHATKRHRPIASGALPLPVAILVSPFLALTALALSGIFNFHLFGVVSLYFAITVCYSLHFKRLMMVDIVTLSVLYTLRLLGGSAATGIVPSFWLLAFSFFIFLSLAMLKRYSELFNLHREGMEKPHGRGYIIEDKTPLGIMGIATAFISVLIFMLYFNSPNVQIMYQRPAILIFIVPLLVFWLCRLWLLAFRGEVNEDPVLFVSRDKQSLMIVAACLMLLGVAGIGEVP